MDTFAAMALASLPPTKDVMDDKPRQQSDFIINHSMVRGIMGIGVAMFAVMFIYLIHCFNTGGGMQTHELSMFFTAFVMLQFWNLFNAKALGTVHSAFRGLCLVKVLTGILVVVFVGQWVIVTFGGKMFRTVPLSLLDWVYVVAATSLVLWAGEIWRLVARLITKNGH